MSPTLIHHHMDHSSLLLLFACNFLLQQVGETWFPPSATQFLNCSVPVFMHNGFRIVAHPHLLECQTYIQVLSSLISQAPFISRVSQVCTFSPSPFSGWLFQTFITQLGSCAMFYIPSQDPSISTMNFLKSANTKVYCQCCQALWISTNAQWHVIQNSFTILKIPLFFIYSALSPAHASGKHGSAYHLYSFTFCRNFLNIFPNFFLKNGVDNHIYVVFSDYFSFFPFLATLGYLQDVSSCALGNESTKS